MDRKKGRKVRDGKWAGNKDGRLEMDRKKGRKVRDGKWAG